MKDFVGIDECIIICKTEIEELGQGTCPLCVVRFSLEDMDKVKQFDKWKVEKGSNKVYANKGTVNTYLHRLIYGDCKGKKVLAKNGNYFDCRKANLYVKP